MSSQSPRSSARLLAPLALVVCAGALLIVIASSSGGGSSPSDGGGGSAADKTAAQTTTAPKHAKAASYTVKSGDTLGGIAEKTGVPVETLQEINPALDPQALIAGQKIKLRE